MKNLHSHKEDAVNGKALKLAVLNWKTVDLPHKRSIEGNKLVMGQRHRYFTTLKNKRLEFFFEQAKPVVGINPRYIRQPPEVSFDS